MALNFAANLSMLYTDVPFLDRFHRAARAGFTTVEFLFPYDAGVESVKSRLDDLGLKVALFNYHAGDIKNGEWGTLSNPDRREYFKWSSLTAVEAAKALHCSRLHAMFGQRVLDYDLAAQIDCACENLIWAAPQAADAGVELLLEALNPIDFPRYALNRVTMALEIIRRINLPNVRLQYDVYHAQMTEGNLINTITTNFSDIGHIQIADVPGRHQPGTGEINFPAIFAALDRLGYTGYIGLEYKPLGESDSSLSWLPLAERKVPR
jgi:hydroxypyruvate isomerase